METDLFPHLVRVLCMYVREKIIFKNVNYLNGGLH